MRPANRKPGILIGLFTIALAAGTAYPVYQHLTTWTAADAVVIGSEDLPRSRAHARGVLTTFTYQVAGKKLQSSTVNKPGPGNAPGTHHRLLYNPSQPAQEYYEPGIGLLWWQITVFVLGVIFLALSVWPDQPPKPAFAPATVTPIDLTCPPRGVRFTHLPRGFSLAATTARPGIGLLLLPAAFLCYFTFRDFPSPSGRDLIAFGFGLFLMLLAMSNLTEGLELRRDLDCLHVLFGDGLMSDYPWSQFRSVREENQYGGIYQPATFRIVLDGERRLEFGEGLSDERRRFVTAALASVLPDSVLHDGEPDDLPRELLAPVPRKVRYLRPTPLGRLTGAYFIGLICVSLFAGGYHLMALMWAGGAWIVKRKPDLARRLGAGKANPTSLYGLGAWIYSYGQTMSGCCNAELRRARGSWSRSRTSAGSKAAASELFSNTRTVRARPSAAKCKHWESNCRSAGR